MENNSRYKLFKETIGMLKGEQFSNYKEVSKVIDVYEDACFLLKDLEITENYQKYASVFLEKFRANLRSNDKPSNLNETFVQQAREKIEQYIRERKNECKYNQCLARLLKIISDYQNKFFKNKKNLEFLFLTTREFMPRSASKMNSCFLSYAYDDRGLSFALYVYFYHRNCFLYVDWMQNEKTENIRLLKEKLSSAINEMEQFLLLRTPNSELQTVGGARTIRQWCAWECGVAYNSKTNIYSRKYERNENGRLEINHNYNKETVRLFLVNFFEKEVLPNNPFVSDFLLMHYVDGSGTIQPL